MALILCPECGREISDKATHCVHCGFPINHGRAADRGMNLNSIGGNICYIAGVKYDLSDLKKYVLNRSTGDQRHPFDVAAEWARRINGASANGIIHLMADIQKMGSVPETYDLDQYTIKLKEDDGLIHCPKCNSTAVTAGQRGYSVVWGFVGSNRTMNRCAKCGHKWEPRR